MFNFKMLIFIIVFVFGLDTGAYATDNTVSKASEIKEKLTFVMGYREDSKAPYIAAKGDNSGFYYDLFSHAAKEMGASFEVVRKPKVRILNDIKEGKVDFYPGLTFGTERAEYIYFMVEGLPGGDVGLSLKSLGIITDMCQLEGKIIVQALGGSDLKERFSECNLTVERISALDTERAVRLLRMGRADFYLYNRPTVESYIDNNPSDDLLVHYSKFSKRGDFFCGFSRKSSKYAEEANPNYDPSKEISPINLPYRIKTDCPAYKFEQIIRKLVESGETEKLYRKHRKKN